MTEGLLRSTYYYLQIPIDSLHKHLKGERNISFCNWEQLVNIKRHIKKKKKSFDNRATSTSDEMYWIYTMENQLLQRIF